MKDPTEKAAQLWCLPQHAHKDMDVEFAQSIATALREARREAMAECCKLVCPDCELGVPLRRDGRHGRNELQACRAVEIRAALAAERE